MFLPSPSKKEPQSLHPQPIGDTSGQLETSDGPNVGVSVVHQPNWPSGHLPDSCALLKPNPPTEKLKLANTMRGAEGESRHVHTLASCCNAKASVKSGCTDLNQKFPRVDAHMRRTTTSAFRPSKDLQLGRTEEVIREMDKLRTSITHTTLLQKKLVCTATIGGSVRILLVPTRCP